MTLFDISNLVSTRRKSATSKRLFFYQFLERDMKATKSNIFLPCGNFQRKLNVTRNCQIELYKMTIMAWKVRFSDSIL